MPDKTEKPEKKRRPRRKPPLANRKNAIHITVYDPQGAPVPYEVLEKSALAVLDVAQEYKLVIGTAVS